GYVWLIQRGPLPRIRAREREGARRPPARCAARAPRPLDRGAARAEPAARRRRAPDADRPRARRPQRLAPGARLRRSRPAGARDQTQSRLTGESVHNAALHGSEIQLATGVLAERGDPVHLERLVAHLRAAVRGHAPDPT